MKLLLIVLVLASCQQRQGARGEDHEAIKEQSEIIDGEANTIEAKFPKAKPHTDKIKEATPIIREANDAQQKEIERLQEENSKLKEKDSRRFRWFICSILFGCGVICCYIGINKFGSKFTTLGASMLGGAISAFYYWSWIEKFFLPIIILFIIITLVMARRDKDLENTSSGSKI